MYRRPASRPSLLCVHILRRTLRQYVSTPRERARCLRPAERASPSSTSLVPPPQSCGARRRYVWRAGELANRAPPLSSSPVPTLDGTYRKRASGPSSSRFPHSLVTLRKHRRYTSRAGEQAIHSPSVMSTVPKRERGVRNARGRGHGRRTSSRRGSSPLASSRSNRWRMLGALPVPDVELSSSTLQVDLPNCMGTKHGELPNFAVKS